MTLRLKKLADQVMVITGASSGIGLTTARMAAKRGAKLVLAARNEEALRKLTHEINNAGGNAAYVVADVGKEDEVGAIGRTALERFGTIDTWVNDAGAAIYGKMLETSTVDNRKLFDTNFWGVVYGSLEAARQMRRRSGPFGAAIINLGSEASDRAVPLIGMYSASKHAVKGFTDALRMELEAEKAPISVTLVKPSAIDTPFPLHAKNYMDKEPQLPSPIYAPEIVAKVILHCAEVPERDMFAGGAAMRHSVQGALFPRVVDWVMEGLFMKKQKSSRPPRREWEALDQPTIGLMQRSGTRHDVKEHSLYSEAAMHRGLTTPILAGAAFGVAALAATLTLNKRQTRTSPAFDAPRHQPREEHREHHHPASAESHASRGPAGTEVR